MTCSTVKTVRLNSVDPLFLRDRFAMPLGTVEYPDDAIDGTTCTEITLEVYKPSGGAPEEWSCDILDAEETFVLARHIFVLGDVDELGRYRIRPRFLFGAVARPGNDQFIEVIP